MVVVGMVCCGGLLRWLAKRKAVKAGFAAVSTALPLGCVVLVRGS
jgi:hypothetical protein